MFKVINYTVRIAIVIIGIIFASGLIAPKDGDITRYRVMGVVFILFGIYRIVMYNLKSKHYDFSRDSDTEDSNSDTENSNEIKDINKN